MINTATVISSISRKAGGLFESVKRLNFSIANNNKISVSVIGLEDEFSTKDLNSWEPLSIQVLGTVGPRSFGYSPDLYKTLSDGNYDLIHNHGIWMYPSVAVSRLARHKSTPYIISPHGMLDPWAVNNSSWKKKAANFFYEKNHLHGAACLRALCESEAKSMRDFGLKNPICVIPNGIDVANVNKDLLPPWAEKIPSQKKILLYLGRIHPKKGLSNLLEAWAKLSTSNPFFIDEWHLVIAGWDQGSHLQELSNLSINLNITESVLFIGPQYGEAKQACYSHADAFILPSFSEGLPMVVLEAWSYSLPVVMTPECNLPDGFNIGAAIQIQTEVPKIMNGLIDLFSMNDLKRIEIGSRGHTLVKSNFTWDQIGNEMNNVHQWILGGGPPPSCVYI